MSFANSGRTPTQAELLGSGAPSPTRPHRRTQANPPNNPRLAAGPGSVSQNSLAQQSNTFITQSLRKKCEDKWTTAYTANRAYMEILLPEMEELLEELEDHERTLVRLSSRSLSNRVWSLGNVGFKRSSSRNHAQNDGNNLGNNNGVGSPETNGPRTRSTYSIIPFRKKRQPVPGRQNGSHYQPEGVTGNNDNLKLSTNRRNRSPTRNTAMGRSPIQRASSHQSQLSAGSNLNGSIIQNHTKVTRASRFTMTSANNAGSVKSPKELSAQKLLKELQETKQIFFKALELVRQNAAPSERRIHKKGSICGVYNPSSGNVEWRCSEEAAGIFGVYHPTKKEIIWEEERNHCLYGIYDPETDRVDIRKCFGGGICAVFNPSLNKYEWKSVRGSSVFGVYNPVTKEVEWQTYRFGSILGWWIPPNSANNHSSPNNPPSLQQMRLQSSTEHDESETSADDLMQLNASALASDGINGAMPRLGPPRSVSRNTRLKHQPPKQSDQPESNVQGQDAESPDSQTHNVNQADGRVHWEIFPRVGACIVNRDYENGGYVTLCCNYTNWRT